MSGDLIKGFCMALDLPYKTVAHHAGMDPADLSRFINDRRPIPERRQASLYMALGALKADKRKAPRVQPQGS